MSAISKLQKVEEKDGPAGVVNRSAEAGMDMERQIESRDHLRPSLSFWVAVGDTKKKKIC